MTGVTCRFVESFDWEHNARPQPGDMFWVTFAGTGLCSVHEPPCNQHLYVICPGGHWWDIDGRANNCTMPDDKGHHCWIRHGTPPNITVDKNGVTCSAGAGSIATPNWHGFLRKGVLTQ